MGQDTLLPTQSLSTSIWVTRYPPTPPEGKAE